MMGKIFGEQCVRCNITRTKTQFEGVPTCEKCEVEINADREPKRPCPTCNSPMDKTVVLNVIVDKCPSGHGELARWWRTGSARAGRPSVTDV